MGMRIRGFDNSVTPTASDFGSYWSWHRGAVSDDGLFAVASVSFLESGNFLILHEDKIYSKIDAPADSVVYRLKFTGDFLAIELERKNRRSIDFYYKSGGGVSFSIDGYRMVD